MSRVDVSFLKSKLVGLLAVGVAVAGCSSDGVPNALNIPSTTEENSSSAVVPDSTSLISDPAQAFVIGTDLAAGDTFQASVPGSFEVGEDPNSLAVTFFGEPGAQDDITVPATSSLPLVEAIVPVGICSGPIAVVTNIDNVPGNLEVNALSPLPAPVVNPPAPSPALPNEQITITGEFFAITDVEVPTTGGLVPAPNLTVSPTQITFTLPGNAVDGDVVITNSGCDDGVPDSVATFLDVLEAPTIEQVRFFILPSGIEVLQILGDNYVNPQTFDFIGQSPQVAVNVTQIEFSKVFGTDTLSFANGDYTVRQNVTVFNTTFPQAIEIPVANLPFPGEFNKGRFTLFGQTGEVTSQRRVTVLAP